jgi:hypothetical protein
MYTTFFVIELESKPFFQRSEAAQNLNTWEIWFGIFSVEVWLLILLSFLLSTTFLWLVIRYAPPRLRYPGSRL